MDLNSFPSTLYLLPIPLLLAIYIYLNHRPGSSNPPTYSNPTVLSVSLSPTHNFTKTPSPSIHLVPHLGVQNDAHNGKYVQHLSRMHIQPPVPNLRQVHLIQDETLQRFDVSPAEIGENITTTGIDLLALGAGTKLRFIDATEDDDGSEEQEPPTITITGLRNPCVQIDQHRKGLQEQFIERDAERRIVVRKAGVMSTVDVGGDVRPGMRILVEKPEKFEALGVV